MASAHSLQGLIKWLARDEWRDRFAGVYDAHLQPACESLGVDVDEVVSILGKGWFMTTVWGSAFEDFLTPPQRRQEAYGDLASCPTPFLEDSSRG